MIKILCVCLGNICRSPAAEGILRKKYLDKNMREGIDFCIDSAGTSSWHTNDHPDIRSIGICQKHGIDISSLRARQITPQDGEAFDHILGMDHENIQNIKVILDPKYQSRVHLFCKDPVLDPYYDQEKGFSKMFDQLELASEAWVFSEKK